MSEEEFRRAFCEQYSTEMICAKCLNNPKYTSFDASALVSYCEHRRAGLCLYLDDYKPDGPAHILYPLSHPDFLAAVLLLNKFGRWIKGIQTEYEKRSDDLLSNIPEGSMAKT